MKLLSSTMIWTGDIFSLYSDQVLLDHGVSAQRDLIRHPGGAAILLMRDEHILLVRHCWKFRPASWKAANLLTAAQDASWRRKPVSAATRCATSVPFTPRPASAASCCICMRPFLPCRFKIRARWILTRTSPCSGSPWMRRRTCWIMGRSWMPRPSSRFSMRCSDDKKRRNSISFPQIPAELLYNDTDWERWMDL